MKLKVFATAVVAAAFGMSANAQTVTTPIGVSIDIVDAQTLVFIDQSTAPPTFSFSAIGVDVVNAPSALEDTFTLCVTGTSAGGFRMRNTTFSNLRDGTVLTSSSGATDIMRANIQAQPPGGIRSVINSSQSSFIYSYGSSCDATDPENIDGFIFVREQPNVDFIPADTYTGTIELQVIPE